ncbi:MAG TPA: hypothetical protein VGZ69_01975 [Candidatus Rhabdochlamydia sp.]|jgi:hypothetical protein|nr:hypothetical protein [Candidatus Rhabdochlamydia sp.]
MAKTANAINIPASSSTPAMTLGNGTNFLGTNALDCKGSAAFGTFAGIAAPTNGIIVSGFLGVGTATQFLTGSTAELVSPPTSAECDFLQTSYVGSSATNASSLLHYTARGTALAPTANQSGDLLAVWGARGYTGSAFATTSKATISMITSQVWTTANNGTVIPFSVTQNGTTTFGEIARVTNLSTTYTGVAITDLGSGLLVAEGANARMGLAVLVLGVVTVLNNTITANTRIFLTNNAIGLVSLGQVSVTSRVPGVSFTITSQLTTDLSPIAWILFEPSP